MKANELRIGNYVFDPGNELLVIIGIHHDFDDDGSGTIFFGEPEYFGRNGTDRFKAVELNGIPLTPEWLERFGFTHGATQYDGTMVFYGKQYLYFKDGVVRIDLKTPDIRYVHQLQNLYFALTGEELALKEDVK